MAGGGWVKVPSSGRVAHLARSRLALTGLRGGRPESGSRTLSSGDPPQDRGALRRATTAGPDRGNRDGRYIPPPARGMHAGGGGSVGRRLRRADDVQVHGEPASRRGHLVVRAGLLAGLDRSAALLAVLHAATPRRARDHARRSWWACGHAVVGSVLQAGHLEQWSASRRYRLSTVTIALIGSPPARGAAVPGRSRTRRCCRRTARTCRRGLRVRPAPGRRRTSGSRAGAQ